MNIKEAVKNSEASLTSLLTSGKAIEFHQELTKFYPRMIKFFPDATFTYLGESGFTSLMEEVNSSVKNSLLSNYTSYKVNYETKELELTLKNGSMEKAPLFELVIVLETGFGVMRDSEGFYLKLSYLMQPSQFEIMQLFAYFNLR